jgi:outer membrane protein TolC
VQPRLDQVSSTRKARAYAEAALSAEQKKLQNGFSTSFFVLQLQETLTQARMVEVQAVSDYSKLISQLAFADGSILDKQHLSVETK